MGNCALSQKRGMTQKARQQGLSSFFIMHYLNELYPPGKQELSSLFKTHHLNELCPPVKFQDHLSYGFGVNTWT